MYTYSPHQERFCTTDNVRLLEQNGTSIAVVASDLETCKVSMMEGISEGRICITETQR